MCGHWWGLLVMFLQRRQQWLTMLLCGSTSRLGMTLHRGSLYIQETHNAMHKQQNSLTLRHCVGRNFKTLHGSNHKWCIFHPWYVADMFCAKTEQNCSNAVIRLSIRNSGHLPLYYEVSHLAFLQVSHLAFLYCVKESRGIMGCHITNSAAWTQLNIGNEGLLVPLASSYVKTSLTCHTSLYQGLEGIISHNLTIPLMSTLLS